MFSPWYISKDRMGIDTYINEMTTIRGITNYKILPFDRYGRFLRDNNMKFPTWYGYFDNHFQMNREWAKSGRKEVLSTAKWERIDTPEMLKQINSLKIKNI